MENKFCSNCGNQISSTEKYCSKCGSKIIQKSNEKMQQNNSVTNIIRYIFGGIFIFGSLSNLLSGNWYGIIELLFAISLFPILYKKFISNIMENNKTIKLLQIIIPIVLFIIFFICIPTDNMLLENDSSYSKDEITENNSGQEKEETQKKELTESEKMIIKISSLINAGLAYDTGSYIKGDITPGEYVFVKFIGSGSYYCEKDLAGNIVDNENFDSFGYVKVHGVGNLETQGVLVNVSALEQLGVSGGKQLYEILNEQINYSQGGYYKVGTDLESGNYVVESIGGSGYYSINSGPVSNSDIIDNDNFSGRVAVSLTNGQYIEVSRATITKQN